MTEWMDYKINIKQFVICIFGGFDFSLVTVLDIMTGWI